METISHERVAEHSRNLKIWTNELKRESHRMWLFLDLGRPDAFLESYGNVKAIVAEIKCCLEGRGPS